MPLGVDPQLERKAGGEGGDDAEILVVHDQAVAPADLLADDPAEDAFSVQPVQPLAAVQLLVDLLWE